MGENPPVQNLRLPATRRICLAVPATISELVEFVILHGFCHGDRGPWQFWISKLDLLSPFLTFLLLVKDTLPGGEAWPFVPNAVSQSTSKMMSKKGRRWTAPSAELNCKL